MRLDSPATIHRSPHPRPAGREGGIALFIVLVTVLILTIVIFQLTFTTKIEERISQNRQGFLEMSQALLAVARTGVQSLESDLMEDLGFVTEETGEEETDPNKPPEAPPPAPGPGEEETPEPEERFDTRHESWAHLQNQSLNDVEVELRIFDGEGRIDLNHLFEYAQRPEEEEEEDPADPPGGPPAGPPADPADPADPDDPEDPLAEQEEEYEPPTPEELEDAEIVLSRLFQGVIAANEEAGFEYAELPDPELAAREIVGWVQQIQSEPESRLIRSLEQIRGLDGVSWELFHGPAPPELDEEDEDGESEDDPLAGLVEDLGEIPGYEQVDEGVLEIARPIGIRDVLTTHSTGKLNLNTARPEVIAALLLGFEDLEEAREIALQIDTHLNSYPVEDEEAPVPAGDETEEAASEFNEFRTFEDLSQVDETWSEESASEPSVMDLLREYLEPVAEFRSTFFTIRLEAERDDRKLSGTMQTVRNEKDIIVLSWEETDG